MDKLTRYERVISGSNPEFPTTSEPTIKVCKLCGGLAKVDGLGWRHKSEKPWEDVSGFCNWYGYSILVVDKPIADIVAERLDR